jgi:hypothetical protein
VSALHFQLARVSGGAGDGIASEGGEMVAEGNSGTVTGETPVFHHLFYFILLGGAFEFA